MHENTETLEMGLRGRIFLSHGPCGPVYRQPLREAAHMHTHERTTLELNRDELQVSTFRG